LVGRGRPEEVVEVLGAESREERVEVKARLVDDVALDAGIEDFDRGRPYREDDEDAIAIWERVILILRQSERWSRTIAVSKGGVPGSRREVGADWIPHPMVEF